MERSRQHQSQHRNPRWNQLSSSSSTSSSWRQTSNHSARRNRPPAGTDVDRARRREDPISSPRDPTHDDVGGNRPKSMEKEEASFSVPNREREKERDAREFESLVGTCPHMCPVGEMAQRERLRDLAVFERLHGNPVKTSPELAVKKFCRTISTKDVQLSDIRPLTVLESTLDYLMNLMNSTTEPFEVVHDFVFDRTRSIRQDLSMQNIVCDRAIHMYEKMVEFHLISHHRLRVSSTGPNNLNISSLHHLNVEQLAKVLSTLYNLYDLNRVANTVHENEPEYRSLYVLLCLDSKSLAEGERLSLWFRRVPMPVIKSKEMAFARRVLRYFWMGNYKQFLGLIASEGSYLQYCTVEPFIEKVRAQAVACINNSGYKLHPYPIAYLSNILMMKESEVETFCNACGLETSSDGHGNKILPTKQPNFSYPNSGFQNYSFLVLEKYGS